MRGYDVATRSAWYVTTTGIRQRTKPHAGVMSVLHEFSPELEAAFDGVEALALDIEGVDLGRNGKISLVQLATNERYPC